MNHILKRAWRDDRPFRKRLLFSAIVGFSITFTFILFGVIDLYLNNLDMYPFGINILLGPLLLAGLCCFVILTLLGCVFKGWLYDIVLSLFVGLLLAGYVQGNFLNLNLGEMTGDEINWGQYATHGYINIAIWVVIMLLPLICRIFLSKAWKKLIVILPSILVAMQLVGFFSTALQTSAAAVQGKVMEAASPYVSDKGICDLSPNKNVLVFILDRLDGKYVDSVRRHDPKFFDDMEGFTYYPDNISLYCKTYPSVPYMLTGSVFRYDIPAEDYYADAYQNGTFIPDLRNNNFTTKLYISPYYTYENASQLDGLADNLSKEGRSFYYDRMGIINSMLKFSAYRYAPHAMKPLFWFSPDILKDTVVEKTKYPPFESTYFDFATYLKNNKLSLSEEKNNFMFLHLEGCHAPFVLEENGEINPKGTTLLKQTIGSFNLIKEYMRQMKALGIYDSSTIIITGDHGESEDYSSPTTYKTTGLFVKPSGSKRTPCEISRLSVSHENFQPTVLQGAGINSGKYGKSVWELTENDNRVRKYFYKVSNPNGRLEEYEIRGNAEIFSNWRHIRDYPLIHDRG